MIFSLHAQFVNTDISIHTASSVSLWKYSDEHKCTLLLSFMDSTVTYWNANFSVAVTTCANWCTVL